MSFGLKVSAALIAFLGVILAITSFQHPPIKPIQRGYRGLAMVEMTYPPTIAADLAANQVPEAFAESPNTGPKDLQERAGAWRSRRRAFHPPNGRDHYVGGADAGLRLLPRSE
jgi:hypothetical protein